jgi:hypothetical protein
MPTNRFLAAVAAVVTLFAGVSIAVIVEDNAGEDGGRSVTVYIGAPGNQPVMADADKQREGADFQADEEPVAARHEDLADETPPGISREEADDALVTPPGVGPGKAPAGAQNYRIERNYVRNHSPRAPGARVSMFVLHITVSAPGSGQAIRRLFDTPSFGASSTFGAELDGELYGWVPVHRKPWTQGAFNSVSESVEIVTYLRTRAQWLEAPLIKRGILAALTADRLRARGLPPKLVDPVGCTPKAGYTDHDRLECGNNHVDVGTGFPWDVFGRQVRRAYAGESPRTRRLERSHRIVHAKLRARCRTRQAAAGRGCRSLRERNRELRRLLRK